MGAFPLGAVYMHLGFASVGLLVNFGNRIVVSKGLRDLDSQEIQS